MVANISQTGNIAHFASARQHAWHRLGTVLPDAMTAEQALAAAHLAGWDVRKVPEFAHVPATLTEDGVQEAVTLETGKFSTIRTNPITSQPEVLGGGLGPNYTVIQNEAHAVTPVRVVCQNTLSAALHTAKNRFSIRHTSGAGMTSSRSI